MIELDKIIAILKYCGPQTYNDLLFQGFQGNESDLEQLVSRGILSKSHRYYHLDKQ